MDVHQLEEANQDIAMLEELKLPIPLEQLGKRKALETEYLRENVIPQVQSHIQSLVEHLHKSFCLIVEYEYGSPVEVRIAEKKQIKDLQKNNKPLGRIISKKYKSERIEQELNVFLKTLPKSAVFYKFILTQSYNTLSKLLRILQTKDVMKYTSSLFEILKLPTTGKLSPTEFVNLLEPEQFVLETTKEGSVRRIVLWTQSQKVEIINGIRNTMFEADGVTPIMIDKTTKIKEGQWSFKILCDIMAQKEYFANLHS